MNWQSFTLNGITYDLSHLHNVTITMTQPAKDEKPEVSYEIDVEFGLHCIASLAE